MTRRLACLTTLALVLVGLVTAGESRAQRPDSRAAAPMLGLSDHVDGTSLTAEEDAREWTLSVTSEEATAGGTFRIGYLSAASVLPGLSLLALTINGRSLGTTPILPPTALRSATFAVPPGALVSGPNRVRIAAIQRHRVDCSLAAAGELWTRLDPASTGLMPARVDAGPRDLANAMLDATGSLPIRVVLAEMPAREATIRRAIVAAQAVALIAGNLRPRVTFGPPSESGAGIDILFAEGARGPRPSVIIVGDDAAQDEQVARLVARAEASARGTGLATLGGERISLAEQIAGGLEPFATSRRFTFGLALPADMLAAGNAKVEVDVALAGTASHALVDVVVGGRSVASALVRLAGSEGSARARLLFPLDRLRPGDNRITLAIAPSRAVSPDCAPAEGGTLRILADSALVVPPVARLDRAPDLSILAAGAPSLARLALHVPTPDSASIGAAATLMARLALARGRILPIDFSTSREVGSGPTLAVGVAPGFARPTLVAAGIDPDALEAAWRHRTLPPQPSISHRRFLREDRIPGCGAAAFPGAASGTAPLMTAHLVIAQGEGRTPDRALTVVTAAEAALLAEAVACLTAPRVWSQLTGALSLVDASEGRLRAIGPVSQRYADPLADGFHNARRVAAAWLTLNPTLFIVLSLVLALMLAASSAWFVAHVGRRV